MSDAEARDLLRTEFVTLQAVGYSEVVGRLADKQEEREVAGESGAIYHVELQGFWDDRREGELRVVASIDDGGLRAFLPFTDSFTIDPNGRISEHSPA